MEKPETHTGSFRREVKNRGLVPALYKTVTKAPSCQGRRRRIGNHVPRPEQLFHHTYSAVSDSPHFPGSAAQRGRHSIRPFDTDTLSSHRIPPTNPLPSGFFISFSLSSFPPPLPFLLLLSSSSYLPPPPELTSPHLPSLDPFFSSR